MDREMEKKAKCWASWEKVGLGTKWVFGEMRDVRAKMRSGETVFGRNRFSMKIFGWKCRGIERFLDETVLE